MADDVLKELRDVSADHFAYENRPTGMTDLLDEAAEEIERLRFSPEEIALARRVDAEYRRLDAVARAARREWRRTERLTDAIVRDDTRKKADAMEDAGRLARAILERVGE